MQGRVEKEFVDKAKSGELKATKPPAPVLKKGRWDDATPKVEALGAGAMTPSAQTPGSTQRRRLDIRSTISAAAADVYFLFLKMILRITFLSFSCAMDACFWFTYFFHCIFYYYSYFSEGGLEVF